MSGLADSLDAGGAAGSRGSQRAKGLQHKDETKGLSLSLGMNETGERPRGRSETRREASVTRELCSHPLDSAGTGFEAWQTCGEQSQQGCAEPVPLTRPASGRTDNTPMTREKAVAQRVPQGKEGTRAEDERERGALTRLRSGTTAREG
eukprot:3156718-Rhodomonas_salina.1